MENILYAVIGLSITSIFVELLCAGTQMGKYVRAVYGIISVLVILSVGVSSVSALLRGVREYDIGDEPETAALCSRLVDVDKRILTEYAEYRLRSSNFEVVRIELEYDDTDEIVCAMVVLRDGCEEVPQMTEIVTATLGIDSERVRYEYEEQ